MIVKPTNFPTQGHPNRRKIRLKVAFGPPLFPTANSFSWVGIDFIQETDYKKPNPTKFSANTLYYYYYCDFMRRHMHIRNPFICDFTLTFVSCRRRDLESVNLTLLEPHRGQLNSNFKQFVPRTGLTAVVSKRVITGGGLLGLLLVTAGSTYPN